MKDKKSGPKGPRPPKRPKPCDPPPELICDLWWNHAKRGALLSRLARPAS